MGVEKKSVTLTIRGKKYPLRTVADGRRLDEVLELVNTTLDKLEATAASGAGVSELKLVMLALLNLADECLSSRRSLDYVEGKSEKLADEIRPLIDAETIDQLDFSGFYREVS